MFAGLGYDPQPETALRLAARPELIVVDAIVAGGKTLRRLARALPPLRVRNGVRINNAGLEVHT